MNKDPEQNPATLSLSATRDIMEVNYFGVIQTTVTLLPLVRKSTDGGVIVNVSSLVGSNSFLANPKKKFGAGSPANTNKLAAYSSSKAALNSYTISLSHELREEGIKVNLVTPGLTSTNLSGGAGKTAKAGAEVLLPWALLDKDGPTCMLSLMNLTQFRMSDFRTRQVVLLMMMVLKFLGRTNIICDTEQWLYAF